MYTTGQGTPQKSNTVKIKTHNRIINVLFYTLSLSYSQIRLQGRWWGWSQISNGNASETKANESFDNGVFFKAKRTPSIVSKLFSKRSEHIT
jgi:hypothetical protein